MKTEQLGSVNKRLESPVDLLRQEHLVQTFCENMYEHDDMPDNIYEKKRGDYFCLWNKLPDKYRIDYLITADFGKMIAMAECKWYPKSWRTLDEYTVKLSLLKVKDLLAWAHYTNTKPFFLIRVRDGFYYWKPTIELLTTSMVEMGGRLDRGYAGDFEPMVSVPERYWNCYHVGQVTINCPAPPLGDIVHQGRF